MCCSRPWTQQLAEACSSECAPAAASHACSHRTQCMRAPDICIPMSQGQYPQLSSNNNTDCRCRPLPPPAPGHSDGAAGVGAHRPAGGGAHALRSPGHALVCCLLRCLSCLCGLLLGESSAAAAAAAIASAVPLPLRPCARFHPLLLWVLHPLASACWLAGQAERRARSPAGRGTIAPALAGRCGITKRTFSPMLAAPE